MNPGLLNPKVCFISGLLGQGGAERQLFYMLKSLQETGADPYVLCLTKGDFWEERIKALGIPVTWVGEAKSRIKRLARIIKEIRKNPPDIIQSQHFFTNLYLGLAARVLRLPDIGAIRSNGAREFHANGRLIGTFNMRAPKVIAANSRAGLEYARTKGVPERKLYYLPNAVDTNHFRPAENRNPEIITLISVGRLIPEKRFDRFISILGDVKKKTKHPVKGLIIGPDSKHNLREGLQKQAAQLGLGHDSIEFQGAASDMAPIYRQADICVLTSDAEGTPNVLMEAMASGLPVVATEVGGVPEIVRNGETGFTAKLGDDQKMIEDLLQLINAKDLRISFGCQARRHIETNHSVNRLPHFLDKLYRLTIS